MFFFKKLVSPLFFPLTILLFFLILSLISSIKSKGIKKTIFLMTSLLLFLAFSCRFFDPLIAAYENIHPPLKEENLSDLSSAYIVVLGGGINPLENRPLISQFPGDTLKRLVEGLLLGKKLKQSKIILSGGKVFCNISEASVMFELAKSLDYPLERIILEEDSKDTKDQAVNIKKITGDAKIVLITSAYHMPRSVLLFKKQGLNVIPCPVAHLISPGKQLKPMDFFPSPESIRRVHKFVRELLGIGWSYINGQI